MKATTITTLALASHGLAFDLGAFIHGIANKFLHPKVDIDTLNAKLHEVPAFNMTEAFVPRNHNYAPNVFDSKLFPAIPDNLDLIDNNDDLNAIYEAEFNIVSTVMNTLVVVDFNRKKILPLDLVDAELPLNPQSFKAVKIRMKKPKVARAELMKFYSASAYCKEVNLMNWSCGENCAGVTDGTRVVKYMSNEKEKTAGFVAVNEREKMIVVSYRGSSNLNNWINNAMIILVPFDLAKVTNCTIENRLLVHRGFQIMTRSLLSQTREALEPLLAQYKDYKVAVTGHSAGGAIATLMTAALGGSGLIPFKKMTLVTFGQPRVGDAAFTTYLNSQPLTAARVTNGVDPVNILPTQEMGFHHQHNEFFLSRSNNVDTLRVCDASSHTENPGCARFNILPKRAEGHYEYFGQLNTDC
ncbi:hypothetical protein DSO57_1031058 [Entomophthora muscae]|uniref:Uncharacterized protein n=1 Tax=Entomophthora muscae TaxID=34485 RepID=A0ACC2T0Z9_9FUNG|nr:hypothetical protein DSO57_1031058 [Entomophthora muscae]